MSCEDESVGKDFSMIFRHSVRTQVAFRCLSASSGLRTVSSIWGSGALLPAVSDLVCCGSRCVRLPAFSRVWNISEHQRLQNECLCQGFLLGLLCRASCQWYEL